jgi:membrane protease YdiL (CAAX protease family)
MGYRFIDVLREYLNFDFGLLKWYLLSPMIVYLSVLVYILIGYPLGYIDISNIFTYTSGDGIEFTPMQVVLLLLISSYTASISVNALFAFGEEVGWRGFLFNLLEPHYSILKMSVIIGMVWGFWHLSAIVLLGYIRQYSNLYELLTTIFFYVLWVVVISVSHVYLRYISNSILPSISLHGGVNALWNITLLISTESLPFELGSLGIVGIISWIIVSIPIVLYSYFIGIMDKSR